MADKNPNGEPNPLSNEGISSEDNPLAKNGALQEEEGPAPIGEEEEIVTEGGEVPEVAPTGKAKNFLVLGIILVAGLFLIISLLSRSKPKPLTNAEAPVAQQQLPENTVPAPPAEVPSAPAAPLAESQLPPPPAINENIGESAPPPPPASALPAPTVTAPKPPAPEDKEMAGRLKAGIMVISGAAEKDQGGSGGTSGEKKPYEVSQSAPIGDTTNMIAQGKMIDAIVESAINTDFPGPVRAIVSRDVYAESGRNILVPKGSRLIGAYNADVKRGQARVYIIWNRLIRPDGINIELDSPGTDTLGRTGNNGQVDEKYMEIFGNALLFSAIDFAFADVAQSLSGSQGVTQTENPSGSTTVSGSPTALAASQAVQGFGSTVQSVVGGLVNVKPTITLDQGTPIKVFVNRDLMFNQKQDSLLDQIFK